MDEADRGRVQIGSGVRVRVDAVPDRELTGTLKDISVVAKPDFTTWPPVRNFDVVVSLSDADARLRSGMSASARVELDRLPRSWSCRPGRVSARAGHGRLRRPPRRRSSRAPSSVLRRGRDQIAIASGVNEGERVALKEPEQEGAKQ